MNVDSIQNGIVIDHITPGRGMDIYRYLHLEELDCTVAIMLGVRSSKNGNKDLIKIDAPIELNVDVLGFIDPFCTVNIIENSRIIRKFSPELPARLTDVLHCRNPRCITQAEPDLPHVFVLSDPAKQTYRCLYCETVGKR